MVFWCCGLAHATEFFAKARMRVSQVQPGPVPLNRPRTLQTVATLAPPPHRLGDALNRGPHPVGQ